MTTMQQDDEDFSSPDLESRLGDDDHQAIKIWLRLLTCSTRIEDQIRNRLRRDFGTTLPRFDLMAQLERHPEGLTMRALSQRLMVTGGNVTGITDQLEAEGLVQRVPHPSDRRSFSVKLTPSGRRQFKRMAATHEGWVVELLAGWTPAQKTQVYELLAVLKKHLAGLDAATVADAEAAAPAAAAKPARTTTKKSKEKTPS
jgi:DNA-binding MarR family transcriptional regulator